MRSYFTPTHPAWGLFDDLLNVRRSFDDWFDSADVRRWPKVRAWADDDALTVEAEVPGVDPKQIRVEIDGDVLVIAGERNTDAGDAQALLDERFAGAFERKLQLPFRVDASKVDAKTQNGLLKICVPKAPEEKSRKITVEAA